MSTHDTQKQWMFALMLVASLFLYFITPILSPFVVGAFLAYLAHPWVVALEKRGVPRLAGVSFVFISLFTVLILAVLLAIPLLQKQMTAFLALMPKLFAWLQDVALPWANTNLDLDPDTLNIATLKGMLADNWEKAGGVATIALKTLLHSSKSIFEWMMLLILTPVVTFYLMCDWVAVTSAFKNLLPRRYEPIVIKLLSECQEVLSAFFRGQLGVMVSLSVVYALGLSLLGLHLGVTIGVIAGMTSIIPYLGAGLGVALALLAAWFQLQSLHVMVGIIVLFVLGHLLEHIVLTPYWVGNRIGLHPVAVIFAVLAGGCLFGFSGVLLALPLAAMLMVWLRYWHQQYRKSTWYLGH